MTWAVRDLANNRPALEIVARSMGMTTDQLVEIVNRPDLDALVNTAMASPEVMSQAMTSLSGNPDFGALRLSAMLHGVDQDRAPAGEPSSGRRYVPPSPEEAARRRAERQKEEDQKKADRLAATQSLPTRTAAAPAAPPKAAPKAPAAPKPAASQGEMSDLLKQAAEERKQRTAAAKAAAPPAPAKRTAPGAPPSAPQ